MLLRLRCRGRDAAIAACIGLRQRLPEGDHNVLRHALVEGNNFVTHLAIGACVVKDSDDRGIAAFENAGDTAETTAVAARRREFHQHLVALHGAVDLIGWNEDIVFFDRSLARVGTDKPVAIAMQVEATGDEVITCAGAGTSRNAPVLAIGFDQVSPRSYAGKLLEQQAALAAAAEAKLAHQLLVSGFAPGGACNLRQQVTIGHSFRVGQASGLCCHRAASEACSQTLNLPQKGRPRASSRAACIPPG